MIILGIETSCDETACAVLQKTNERITILSNVIASSSKLQAKYGGIIPEQAARQQIKAIIPVIEEALRQAFPKSRLPRPARGGARNDGTEEIDAIAVTYGPGLIGSLLVGVETAKTLSLVWKKPLIPVNHLIGHFYANWINQSSAISYQLSDKKQKKSDDRRLTTDDYPKFPCLGLLVSGGHTDLVLFKNHGKYKYLGGTRDDAAGECFDKCARLLGLPYPGGVEISKLAKLASQGDALKFKLPRPMIDSKDFDFSFSGLKTAVANLVHTSPVIASERSERGNLPTSEDPSLVAQDDKRKVWNDKTLANLAASIEQAIVDVLVTKTVKAVQTYHVDQIMIAGGVAANRKLVSELKRTANSQLPKAEIYVPAPELCTDNAAMIAAAAFLQKPIKNPLDLQADPNLSLSFLIGSPPTRG